MADGLNVVDTGSNTKSRAVDLDPEVRDVFDIPVPRVTYKNHPYEQRARAFYLPTMKQIVSNAGATAVFTAPC